MSGKAGESDVIVEMAQPCSNCGAAAHIVLKDGRRLCASCYREDRGRRDAEDREERTPPPTPPAA